MTIEEMIQKLTDGQQAMLNGFNDLDDKTFYAGRENIMEVIDCLQKLNVKPST